ncbi:MAG: Asp-tRNA(Asn)/Glu-tRNA(Gln) amidotransferase subunit GatB [Deltaproteobacteria bacterium]|nr:MAG: Asp-tRNA(Asn)/Glu-tRNA(Gln) amidotransferase subunit GatB [Deltaproteobacteria bacterium]
MAIGRKEVEHIAALARLSLSEEEKDRLEKDLNAILGYVEKLGTLNTEGVEPTSHAIDITNAFREDVLTPFDDREKILDNAPERVESFFKVPPISEGISST